MRERPQFSVFQALPAHDAPGHRNYELLSVMSDAKTSKGVVHGWMTAVMYLAPHRLSGKNVCANATPG